MLSFGTQFVGFRWTTPLLGWLLTSATSLHSRLARPPIGLRAAVPRRPTTWALQLIPLRRATLPPLPSSTGTLSSRAWLLRRWPNRPLLFILRLQSLLRSAAVLLRYLRCVLCSFRLLVDALTTPNCLIGSLHPLRAPGHSLHWRHAERLRLLPRQEGSLLAVRP